MLWESEKLSLLIGLLPHWSLMIDHALLPFLLLNVLYSDLYQHYFLYLHNLDQDQQQQFHNAVI